MKNLLNKWGDFFWIVLDPWFVVFIFLTALCLVLSFFFDSNIVTSNTLAVVGSITGGIAGGIFQSQMNKKGGETTLEKKGQSAVRNLEAIETQISSLRGWVGEACKKAAKDKNIDLAEVDRHLSTMELHIRSGYEDWIDVVPQLRDENERAKKLEQKLKSSYDALLDEQLKLAQASNAEEKTKLQETITQLETQIQTLKQEGRVARYSSSGSYLARRPGLVRRYICTDCGKPTGLIAGRPVTPLCGECSLKRNQPPESATEAE